MVALAACGDTTTSPRETARNLTPTSSPAFDYSGGGSRQYGDQGSDFTVTSHGGTFSVNGLFTVNFPENSVCNPDRSTYGSTEWDKPCSTLRSNESIKVTARLRLTSNGLTVDFSPELRFSPSTEVTISTDIFAPVITGNRAYFAANPSALDFLAISFSPTLGGAQVADYASDGSLITRVYLKSGSVRRRIKHFSGYMIGGGQPCEPSPDNPDCVAVFSDG
ncbi:MAG: hypothetical protein JWM41_3541 [Gemmatimonadetes bacterium]|nr:hypothetical protein [Gemmatimonadota bacterium]